jgi:hypothetical protein
MTIENEGATAEVENDVVADKPVSMEDTIRDTLHALNDRGNAPEVPDSTIPEEPEEKAARLRDEKGKFAAKAAEPEVPAIEDPAALVPEVPVNQAPNTWKKEAAAVWSKLPPEARAEVERREADFHRGIEQYKTKAQFGETIERTLAPHIQTFQSLNVAPERAIADLLDGDRKLRYGQPHEKAAFMAQLARHYGVDLSAAQEVHDTPVDPNLTALQQQVQQLTSFIQTQQSSVQQQAEQSLNSEISAFAADPNHSHFETVKPHMIALLQAGQAKDLSDAYEQAVYANPTTRAAMLQQQMAAQREEAAKKAQAAREAASINTKPRQAPPIHARFRAHRFYGRHHQSDPAQIARRLNLIKEHHYGISRPRLRCR